MAEETRADLVWRKSSWCESSLCIEVAITADEVHLRDGKQRLDELQLSFGGQSWRGFIAAIKTGALDRQ